MKKISLFFVILASLLLIGCSSNEAKQAVNLLPKAFEALIDEVDNYIKVESVKYICGNYIDDDDDTTLECIYYIHFSYENSTIQRYAEVFVSESTYYDGFSTDVYSYSSSKLLDDEYHSELEWFVRAEKDEFSYIIEVSYETGTLSSTQISKVLKGLK